ncbi:MAG: hypothetical protein P8J27_05335 [Mariniblastus sp.]|nr:hypothetical protein [Mariniblastus sp.]
MLLKAVLSFSVALAALTLAPQPEDLTGIKCVINGKKAASTESSVDYKKGKVYFCCDHCVESFKEDVKLKEEAKFAVKANHQLVLTGQYTQTGCPFSGGSIDEKITTSVGAAKVGFCCKGCLKKVDDLKSAKEKANLVFADAAFKKGFQLKKSDVELTDVKCMMMPRKNVVAKHAVEYKSGKVFFCCGGCVKRYSKDKKKYAAQANQQLVVTGQYKQVGCPISGGDVDDDQASKVGGVTVKFCCDKCKGKVDSTADKAKKAELVFGKRFDKAFEKQ